MDEFQYSYENATALDRIIIFIENFKEDYTINRSSDNLYLSYPLEDSFAMTFNDSNSTEILHSRIDFNQIKYDELMILVKDNFAYFLYLKPFSSSFNQTLVLDEIVGRE